MTIPTEAIRAAAEVLAGNHGCAAAAHERTARAVLEAAAPYMEPVGGMAPEIAETIATEAPDPEAWLRDHGFTAASSPNRQEEL